MSDEQQQNETTYIIDAENAAEMARLIRQGRTVTQNTNALFPEHINRSGIRRVLDIGCGPGEWVLSVASAHPEIQVTGIDISQIMIEYANAQAQEQHVNNTKFQVMSAKEPLNFPDNAFDVVNARFLVAFMDPITWPKLIQECVRITRSGGALVLTETEGTLTNSLANERLYGMSAEAMKRAGQSFSADGRHYGITPMVGKLLRDAGYVNIHYNSYAIDCSAGTDAHQDIYHDLLTAYKLMQPFLIKAGVTTQEEVEGVYQRMLEEWQLPDFCALWTYLTVSGEKP